MSYETFKAEYLAAFNAMMGYSLKQVGAGIYLDKMTALADAYPEFAERAEEEIA